MWWAFPMTGLLHLPVTQERRGLPKFFDASLPACHGLRTPADLHHLAIPVVRVLPSGAFKPSASAKPCRSCTSTSGCAVTPAAYRILCLRFAHLVHRECPHDSALDARLDTGGWLALTRQGLSPCQRRQAYLGAITLRLSRARKPQRSGGFWASAAGGGSARDGAGIPAILPTAGEQDGA